MDTGRQTLTAPSLSVHCCRYGVKNLFQIVGKRILFQVRRASTDGALSSPAQSRAAQSRAGSHLKVCNLPTDPWRVQGFIQGDYADLRPQFYKDMAGYLRGALGQLHLLLPAQAVGLRCCPQAHAPTCAWRVLGSQRAR